jgi:hypothetical protein
MDLGPSGRGLTGQTPFKSVKIVAYSHVFSLVMEMEGGGGGSLKALLSSFKLQKLVTSFRANKIQINCTPGIEIYLRLTLPWGDLPGYTTVPWVW